MRILFVTVALMLAACTDPDTICFDDWLEPSDVYGDGYYTEYREEFEEATGCDGIIGCTERMKYHRCVDNVEFK